MIQENYNVITGILKNNRPSSVKELSELSAIPESTLYKYLRNIDESVKSCLRKSKKKVYCDRKNTIVLFEKSEIKQIDKVRGTQSRTQYMRNAVLTSISEKEKQFGQAGTVQDKHVFTEKVRLPVYFDKDELELIDRVRGYQFRNDFIRERVIKHLQG